MKDIGPSTPRSGKRLVPGARWKRTLAATFCPLIALLASLAAGPALGSRAAAAGAAKTVQADGFASLKEGDKTGSRDKALEDALEKAVEKCVSVMIDDQTRAENYETLRDKIYAKCRNYITNFEITSEKAADPLYRISVDATVNTGELRDDLRTLGLLIQTMRKPRVMVMIPEENVLDYGWWGRWAGGVGTVESEVIRILKSEGFTVVDSSTVRKSIDKEAALKAIQGDDKAAALVAQQSGAEVLITGRAIAEPAGHVANSQLKSYQATVSCRAVKADTGEILGSATAGGSAVHLNAAAGGREAFEQAASKLATDLVDQIAAQWSKEAVGTRSLAVSVEGISKDRLDRLVSMMKSGIRGVSDVYTREFAGNVARLDVDFAGDAEDLGRELKKLDLDGGRFEITAATQNKVDMRYLAPGT